MKLRDFKIGWRLLVQEARYSTVVILGLSVAFAACFLVLSVLLFSFSFDQHIPAVDQVFIAKSHLSWEQSRTHWRENIPMAAKRSVEQSGQPVSLTRVMDISVEAQVIDQRNEQMGGLSQTLSVSLVDPAFPDIFAVQTLAGDIRLALSRPDALALTEESALRLFHGEKSTAALGKSLKIDGKPYAIVAILRNPPETTSVPFSALAGVDSGLWNQTARLDFSDNWKNFEGRLYLKLGASDGIKTAAEKIAKIMEDTIERSPLRTQLNAEELLQLGQQKLIEVELGKLSDSYLDDVGSSANRSRKFDSGIIIVLAVMAGLILLLAMSNFISLAISRTMSRQREIAVRKVMGATAWRILSQISTESILTALLAALLGLLLAWLLLPGFSYFVNFRIENLLTPTSILKGGALALLFAIGIGTVAGAYPAWLAIRTPPARTLSGRGNSATTHSNWLRHIVTVGQFAIGMCFASVALTLAWQTHFASTTDRGFRPDTILALPLNEDMNTPANLSFRDAVARLPDVLAVSVVHDMIGQTAVNPTKIKQADGSEIKLRKKLVDADYFKVFGVAPLAGRIFDAKLDALDNAGVVVIESASLTALGFSSAEAALGQIIKMDGEAMRIIGVTPSILLDSIVFSEPTRPIIYRISRKTETMLINTSGNIEAVKRQIQTLGAEHLPAQVLNIKPLKILLDANIRDAEMVVTVTVITTVTAMLLAAFGMYISSAGSLQRRSREVVLRKLFGATPKDIATLLGREFLLLIAIAASIGLPIAYVLGRLFVEHSSKQAPVGLWPVLAALIGGILVTLIASYRTTAAAMRMSPALALKN